MRSSRHTQRVPERETQRNVAGMWLPGTLRVKLRPDFKPMAAFRTANLQAIKGVCRQVTLLCTQLGRCGGERGAIDGSNFKAVTSRARTFTQNQLSWALARIETKIETYRAAVEPQDQQDLPSSSPTAADLPTTIAQWQQRQAQSVALHQPLEQSGERQLSLTEPESRSLPLRAGTAVCYPVQAAGAAKHMLSGAHAVTKAVTEQAQLAPMAQPAQVTLGGRG